MTRSQKVKQRRYEAAEQRSRFAIGHLRNALAAEAKIMRETIWITSGSTAKPTRVLPAGAVIHAKDIKSITC